MGAFLARWLDQSRQSEAAPESAVALQDRLLIAVSSAEPIALPDAGSELHQGPTRFTLRLNARQDQADPQANYESSPHSVEPNVQSVLILDEPLPSSNVDNPSPEPSLTPETTVIEPLPDTRIVSITHLVEQMGPPAPPEEDDDDDERGWLWFGDGGFLAWLATTTAGFLGGAGSAGGGVVPPGGVEEVGSELLVGFVAGPLIADAFVLTASDDSGETLFRYTGQAVGSQLADGVTLDRVVTDTITTIDGDVEVITSLDVSFADHAGNLFFTLDSQNAEQPAFVDEATNQSVLLDAPLRGMAVIPETGRAEFFITPFTEAAVRLIEMANGDVSLDATDPDDLALMTKQFTSAAQQISSMSGIDIDATQPSAVNQSTFDPSPAGGASSQYGLKLAALSELARSLRDDPDDPEETLSAEIDAALTALLAGLQPTVMESDDTQIRLTNVVAKAENQVTLTDAFQNFIDVTYGSGEGGLSKEALANDSLAPVVPTIDAIITSAEAVIMSGTGVGQDTRNSMDTVQALDWVFIVRNANGDEREIAVVQGDDAAVSVYEPGTNNTIALENATPDVAMDWVLTLDEAEFSPGTFNVDFIVVDPAGHAVSDTGSGEIIVQSGGYLREAGLEVAGNDTAMFDLSSLTIDPTQLADEWTSGDQAGEYRLSEPYGSVVLWVNPDSGAQRIEYSLDDTLTATNALNDSDLLHRDFVIPATIDGTVNLITARFVLQGSNDEADIAGATTASAAETNTPIVLTGTLTSSDVDNANNQFQAETVTGNYGALAITAAGEWTYTANAAFDSLASSESHVDALRIRSIDGTEQIITLTINGTNDAADIGGDTQASGDETDSAIVLTGTLTSTDIDNVDNQFQAQTVSGDYGELEMTASGDWTYTAADAFDSLSGGQSHVDTITVSSADGTEQVITVTLNGTDDLPEFGGDQTGQITETDSQEQVSGTLTWQDPDSESIQLNAPAANEYGELLISQSGDWTFFASQSFDELASGGVIETTYTVTTDTGASAPITIRINGRDDAPTLSVSGTDADFLEGASPAAIFTNPATATIEPDQVITDVVITVDGVSDAGAEVLHFAGDLSVALIDDGRVSSDDFLVDVERDGDLATLTISNMAFSASAFNDWLNALAYENTSERPTQGDRTIAITQLKDSGSDTTGNANTSDLDGLESVINVSGVNDQPQPASDRNSVEVGGFLLISESGVLSNDTDVDGDTLSVTGFRAGGLDLTNPGSATNDGDSLDTDYGTLQINANGTYDYTADGTLALALADGETARDVFTYSVADGKGGSAQAELIITLTRNIDPVDVELTINQSIIDADRDDEVARLTVTFTESMNPLEASDISVDRDLLSVFSRDTDGDVQSFFIEPADAVTESQLVTIALPANSTTTSAGVGHPAPEIIRVVVLGDDALRGDAADETLALGSDAAGFVAGNGGDDVVLGSNGDDTLLGGGGDDVLIGRSGSDHFIGGAEDDRLAGGVGDDTYYLDTLGRSEGAENVFIGNAGIDVVLLANATADYQINAVTAAQRNQFNQQLRDDNDSLSESDRDDLQFDSNAPILRIDFLTDTGRQTDFIQAEQLEFSDTTLVFERIGSTDFVTSDQDDAAFVYNGGGYPIQAMGANAVLGRDGDDRLIGGLGDDDLRGQGGDDILVSLGGSDVLAGGEGDDQLIAVGSGEGTRVALTGGAGADTFIYTPGQIEPNGVSVTDFDRAIDTMAIVGLFTDDQGDTAVSAADLLAQLTAGFDDDNDLATIDLSAFYIDDGNNGVQSAAGELTLQFNTPTTLEDLDQSMLTTSNPVSDSQWWTDLVNAGGMA